MRRSERAAGLALALALAVPGLAQPRPDAHAARAAPVTPARLVGRWTDTGDCAKFVIFRSDGTFLGFDGGQGSWRLARNRLTLTGGRGTVVLTVRSLTGSRMVVVNPDGSVGTSQRC